MQLLNFLHIEAYYKRKFTTLLDQHANKEWQLKEQSMANTQKQTFLKKNCFLC